MTDPTGRSFLSYRRTRVNEASERPIKLNGLTADKKYSVKEINLYPGTRTTIDESKIYSGSFLMNVGINPNVNDRRTSVVLLVTESK